MKGFIISFLALSLSLTLIGCGNSEESLAIKKRESTLSIENKLPKRKVIIKDSVYEPFPPEGKNLHSSSNQGGPQYLPNVDLATPIIITKMPYQKAP